MSYKSVIINNHSHLSYENGWIIINSDIRSKEYLDDIKTIIINSLEVSITSFLISEIVKRNINVVFIDDKKSPCSLLLPYYGTGDMAKKYYFQAYLQKKIKDFLWMLIVQNKLLHQRYLIKSIKGEILFEDNYLQELKPGDPDNLEAFTARKYFYKLFDNDFNRRTDSNINSALNYGYSIILSEMSKIITKYGYSTIFGIHHNNKHNNYNFSCDLIEPFRPIIDKIVYDNRNKEFDKDFKKELILSLNSSIVYDNKMYSVSTCMEVFFIDCISVLTYKKKQLGDIHFYE